MAVVDEHLAVPRGGGMSTSLSAPVGILRARDVAALAQHPGEGEGPVGITPFVGPPVRLFGARRIIELLEQEPQPRGGLGVAQLVSLAKEDLRDGQVLHLFELQCQVEFGLSIKPGSQPWPAGDDAFQARH